MVNSAGHNSNSIQVKVDYGKLAKLVEPSWVEKVTAGVTFTRKEPQ